MQSPHLGVDEKDPTFSYDYYLKPWSTSAIPTSRQIGLWKDSKTSITLK